MTVISDGLCDFYSGLKMVGCYVLWGRTIMSNHNTTRTDDLLVGLSIAALAIIVLFMVVVLYAA